VTHSPTQPPPQPAWAPQPPPRPFNWRRWAIWTTIAAAASFGIFGAIAANDDATHESAACKAAMKRNFERTMVLGDKEARSGRPAECIGIDDKTLQRYVTEIMDEELNGTKP
jgi:hypothetical protein